MYAILRLETQETHSGTFGLPSRGKRLIITWMVVITWTILTATSPTSKETSAELNGDMAANSQVGQPSPMTSEMAKEAVQ